MNNGMNYFKLKMNLQLNFTVLFYQSSFYNCFWPQMAQFCYWQVYKDIDFYFVIAIATISFIIFLYSTLYFIKIFKYYSYVKKQTLFIYIFSIMWSIFYVTKNIYSALQYAFDIRKKYEGSMASYSQTFCVIDSSSTFFLQGLMIFIPFLWLKSLYQFLQKMNRNNKKDEIINKILEIYLIIRNPVYLILFILQLINIQSAESFCNSIIIMIMLQSFLSLCLLSYGIVKLQNNFTPLSMQDKDWKRKFKNHYLIMITFTFIRFVLDFYFIIYQEIEEDEITNCLNYRYQDYTYTTVYLIFGSILMHLLPILMILKINQIDFKQLQYKKMNDTIQNNH